MKLKMMMMTSIGTRRKDVALKHDEAEDDDEADNNDKMKLINTMDENDQR